MPADPLSSVRGGCGVIGTDYPDTDDWADQDGTVHGGHADGAALLDEVRAALAAYVVLPSAEAADALTLWIAATHGQDAWQHAPRAAVVSPEKRCGKSRLIDIAEATCSRPIVTVNISVAALVREITDKNPPTLFIDEADTIFGPKASGDHEDLRGIVNSGHQRGRPYLRYNVTSRTNEKFPTFAMAMLAGIGDLPDTIMDRAIVFRMRRRAPVEHVKPYRTRRDRPSLVELGNRLHGWIVANIATLENVTPVMPLEDRAADTWEPLIAVADLAKGEWPKRARKAALAMVSAESVIDAEASLGARLLADIKAIFGELVMVQFLPSQELVNRLLKVEDAPWDTINRGKEITPRLLANRLRPYGIRPDQNDTKTKRGYRLADFDDAFARYLAVPSVQPSPQGSDQGEEGDTWGDTWDTASRSDTYASPIRPDKCPDPDQAKQVVSDAWTLGTDGEEEEPEFKPCDRCKLPANKIDKAGRRLCRQCAPHLYEVV